MQKTLEIRAFFFNAKTDYLPYYKHFKIALKEELKVKDLLASIQEQNENFAYPEEKLLLKINGLVVEGEQNMFEVVERLGTSLQIDPVNSYRSNNGLIINDDDFMQKYEILAPFSSEEDLAYYKTLYALHYASETENFDREYIGDAVLLLAHKMITEGSEEKEAILEAITSPYSGLFDCEYENNLFHEEDHTATIEALKIMAKPFAKSSFIDNLNTRFAEKAATMMKKDTEPAVIDTEGKQIAYYAGSVSGKTESMHERIRQAGSKAVVFARQNKLSGFSLLEENKPLAFTKAATTLLDALDSGAQVLVVEEEEVLTLFKKYFSSIEKTIGREIALELISAKDFLSQDVKAEA